VLAEEAIREALADYRRRAGLRGPVESSGAHAAIGARDKGEMGV
jgi:hypothetical protein